MDSVITNIFAHNSLEPIANAPAQLIVDQYRKQQLKSQKED